MLFAVRYRGMIRGIMGPAYSTVHAVVPLEYAAVRLPATVAYYRDRDPSNAEP